jgi:hypothetical protein
MRRQEKAGEDSRIHYKYDITIRHNIHKQTLPTIP